MGQMTNAVISESVREGRTPKGNAEAVIRKLPLLPSTRICPKGGARLE